MHGEEPSAEELMIYRFLTSSETSETSTLSRLDATQNQVRTKKMEETKVKERAKEAVQGLRIRDQTTIRFTMMVAKAIVTLKTDTVRVVKEIMREALQSARLHSLIGFGI